MAKYWKAQARYRDRGADALGLSVFYPPNMSTTETTLRHTGIWKRHLKIDTC
jgi:hypothetical protein